MPKGTMKNLLHLFFEQGEVCEIRATGLSGKRAAWEGRAFGEGVVYGYFDDPEKFAAAAGALEKAEATAVYLNTNPCDRALLARSVNRLRAGTTKSKHITDKDITALRRFYIDLDPDRPSGISSTADELVKAELLAKQVVDWLEGELGWPKGIRALSGNGYHIIYTMPDLPNDEEHRGLVEQILKAIAHRFRDYEGVTIDTSEKNPARLMKCYGTMTRKGDSTEERPHRRSYLFKDPPEALASTPRVSLEQLQAVAAMAPAEETKRPAATKRIDTTHAGKMDVEEYLGTYGIEYSV